MIIREIKLYNVGLYAGEHSIKPNVTSGEFGKPITLIGGMNGGGKTSLLDAVMLALYGSNSPSAREERNGYSTYLLSLINRDSSPDTGAWVELHLEIRNEGISYDIRVRRSWRLINVRCLDHLDVWKNGIPDFFLAKSWESYVEELVPLGLAGLFFFDGEKIGRLAEADETPQDVQQSIRSILGIDLVDRLINDLNRVVKQNSSRLKNEDVRNQIESLQKNKKDLSERKNVVRQEKASLTTKIENLKNTLQEKRLEYLRVGGSIAERREELAKEQTNLRETELQAKSELLALTSGPLPFMLVKPYLAKIQSRIHLEEESRGAEAALPLLKRAHSELISWLLQNGDTAGLTPVVKNFIDKQQEKMGQLSEVERVFPLSPIAHAQIDDLEDRLLTEISITANNTLKILREAETNLDMIDRHLLVEVDQNKINDKLKEISDITNKISDYERQFAKAETELNSLDYEVKQIDSQLTKLGDKLDEGEEAGRIVSWAQKSQATMVHFRDRITASKVDTLTSKVKEAFNIITHKTTLVEDIQIDPSTLRISLKDNLNREIPKSRLSSGEKQMLAVAILWGLAQASGRKLPVIVDTPLGRLDSSHRMNFVTQYLPNASHQVMVLSTDTEIVGQYLTSLKPYVGQQYLLSYDNESLKTSVLEGYFATAGGASR